MGRFIAIGDVHGCYHELEALLSALAPTRDDKILFIGDLVNRGPDSRRVIELAIHHHAIALMGNHERRLLTYRTFGDDFILKPYDAATLESLDDYHWNYLHQMKPFWEVPAFETVFVHAGFLPRKPWRSQTISVMTEIQVVSPDGQPARRSRYPRRPHWCHAWKGPPTVVYGHTPRDDVHRTDWTLGIDTGCVYGGYLTAYVLPERKIVQVKARQAYVKR